MLHGRDLSQHVALITGANTGIGFETARSLAKHDCTVILACRNLVSAEKAIEKIKTERAAAEQRCEAVHLDLCSLKSVLEAAKYVRSKYTKLDILILNAGVFGLPYSRTEDGFETTFQINHLSQFYLTLLLKPLLKSGSRVIVVSSESHRYSIYNCNYLHFNVSSSDLQTSQAKLYHRQSYHQNRLNNIGI